MYEVYKDIADTYYSIVKGDYVSKLIATEHKQQNRKKQYKNKYI